MGMPKKLLPKNLLDHAKNKYFLKKIFRLAI